MLDAEIDIAGPAGRRVMPLADLYIGYARQEYEPVTELAVTANIFCRCAPAGS